MADPFRLVIAENTICCSHNISTAYQNHCLKSVICCSEWDVGFDDPTYIPRKPTKILTHVTTPEGGALISHPENMVMLATSFKHYPKRPRQVFHHVILRGDTSLRGRNLSRRHTHKWRRIYLTFKFTLPLQTSRSPLPLPLHFMAVSPRPPPPTHER